MKNEFVLLIGLSLLLACEKQEDIEIDRDSSNKVELNNTRSYDDAMKIAESSLSMLVNSQSSTRTISENRRIDWSACKVITSNNKNCPNSEDTLVYVFNFENNDGFALVSANKNTEPLLAITEKGHFDPDTPSGIPGFDAFITMAKKYVIDSKESQRSLDLFTRDSVVTTHFSHGPLVNVMWGQTHPEGEYCPNGICGCGPTAMAQVMTYYQYPSSLALTFPNADASSQTFSWSNMISHPTGHNLNNCTYNTNIHKSIGRLCRELGYRANSTYNSNSTSTNSGKVKVVMQNLGYTTSGWTSNSNQNMKTQLMLNRLYILLGYCTLCNVGHFWIIDGFDYTHTTTYRFQRAAIDQEWILVGVFEDETNLYHINWGWYGTNNGYFSNNVFNTQNYTIPDTNSNYINHDFSNLYYLTVYH